LRVRKYLR